MHLHSEETIASSIHRIQSYLGVQLREINATRPHWLQNPFYKRYYSADL